MLISQFSLQKISQHINTNSAATERIRGCLVGNLDFSGSYQVINSFVLSNNNKDIEKEISEVLSCLPAGLCIVGLYYMVAEKSSKENVLKQCKLHFATELQIVDLPSQITICHIDEEIKSLTEADFFSYDRHRQQIQPIQVEFVQSVQLDVLKFRIMTFLPLSFTVENFSSEIDDALEALCEQVESSKAVFYIKNSNILLRKQEEIFACPVQLTDDSPCENILSHIISESEDDTFVPHTSKKKENKSRKEQETINVKLLFQVSGEIGREDLPDCVPVLHYEKAKFKNVSVNLPIDVVTETPKSTPISQLVSMFTEGVQRQIKAMGTTIKTYSKNDEYEVCKAYHFIFPEIPHVITVVYPDGISETKLEVERKKLHQWFMLPLNRPYFRKANAYKLDSTSNRDLFLRNPHTGITSSGVEGGEEWLVSGTYTYHHYMQEGFDDNGWGCAYRSLQTLWSWFRHQAYTNLPTPSHKQIQQVLVDVGDKPPKFVGSRQWIGSFEVQIVLNQLLDVSSKIMSVSRGAELIDKARELILHFQMQGTPIMIGGGVLAHTILGVSFSESSGELKFLILDPHYTGAEDLKTILNKGWCGWKSGNFWDQNAMYNLCMPQRPEIF